MIDKHVVYEQFQCHRTSITYNAFSVPEGIITVLRRESMKD